MSIINPGTSINFDGHVLEQQAEAELEKEDQKCQQELRELLTTALPDDLLDDDDGSSILSSDISSDKSASSPKPWQVPQQQQQLHRWANNLQGLHHKLQYTSTPQQGQSANLPNLKTPADYQESNNSSGSEDQRRQLTIQNGGVSSHPARGEIEGADSDEEYNHRMPYVSPGYQNNIINKQQHMPENGHQTYGHQQQNGYGGRNGYTVDAQTYGAQDQFHNNDLAIQNDYQQYGSPAPASPVRYVQQDEGHQNDGHQADRAERDRQENGPQTLWYQADSQPVSTMPCRVQYRGDGAIDDGQQQIAMDGGGGRQMNGGGGMEDGIMERTFGMEMSSDNKVQNDNQNRQRQFLEAANNEESRQLAQLQILYKAKSRELEQVTQELETKKGDSAKEKRILNHQLALANGERDGARASLNQNREILMASQQEQGELHEQYKAKCDQVQALTISKDELLEKLQSSECSIENLAQQLQAIQMSGGAPSTLRREQDDMLINIQEKHQQEMNCLSEKLDKANHILNEKDSESKTLREELESLKKTMDQKDIDHAASVNKLSKSVEENQMQLMQHLQSGSAEEIRDLKLQLKQAVTSRDMSHDTWLSLQDELSDLKEQLQMYESAAELGVLTAGKESPKISESFAHLGVRNLNKGDWETPTSHRSEAVSKHVQNNGTKEEIVTKLRGELERALRNNRAKRNQVIQTQEQLKGAQEECEKQKEIAEDAQFLAKDLEVKLRMVKSAAGRRRSSTLEVTFEDSNVQPSSERRQSVISLEARRNTKELTSLKDECEQLRETIQKSADENSELKKQMVDMVTEHDMDKHDTLERVQNTCLQLHEDRSKQMREHLVSETESDREMLKEAHQYQLQEVRAELDTAQRELCEVKQLYLTVCEEKNRIEDETTMRLNKENEIRLAEAVAKLNSEKDASEAIFEGIKSSLELDYKSKLLCAKTEWTKEMEEKLANAHVDWNKTARKQIAESTSRALQAEWQTKLDIEVETKLQEKFKQVKEDLQSKHVDELNEQRKKVAQDCEQKHKTELKVTLDKAEQEWKETSKTNLADKVQEAVMESRKQWLAGDVNTSELVNEAVSAARLEWIKETIDWKEVKMRWMEEEGLVCIQQKVVQAEEELSSIHAKEISELQKKLHSEMQQSMKDARGNLDQEHKAFLIEHKETLTKALQTTKDELEKEKVELLQRKTLEYQHNLADKEKQWQMEHRQTQDKYTQEKQNLQDEFQHQIRTLRDQIKAQEDHIRAQEESFSRELQALKSQNLAELEAAVDEAKHQDNQEHDEELQRKYNEILERKEQLWSEEEEKLKEKLQESERQLEDVRSQCQQDMRRLKDKHRHSCEKTETELQDLREQLNVSQRELKKTEQRLKREIHHLKSRLTSTNSATLEAMEGRVTQLQKKHAAVVRQMKEEHKKEKMKLMSGNHGDTQSSQPSSMDGDASTSQGLNELREHYLATVQKIRGDVLKYITDMREQCRQTVHTEVMKERNATAKKLRQYYLQCLNQLMNEEKSRSDKSTPSSKMVAMAKALELPGDDVLRTDDIPEVKHNQSAQVIGNIGCRNDLSDSKRSSSSRVKPTATDRGDIPNSNHVASRVRPMATDGGDISNVERWLEHQESSDRSECFEPLKSDTASVLSERSRDSLLGINNRRLESDSLSRLPRQPREFNPAPEKLTSAASQNQSSDASQNQSSDARSDVSSRRGVLGNVTVRTPNGSPGQSEYPRYLALGKENNASLKDTQRLSGCDDPEKRQKSHRSVQPIKQGVVARLDGAKDRKERTRMDDPYKHKSVLSQVSVGVPKSLPAVNEHRLQGYSSKNISYASLATEYNDLPEALDIVDYSPGELLKQDILNHKQPDDKSLYHRTSGDTQTRDHAGKSGDILQDSYKEMRGGINCRPHIEESYRCTNSRVSSREHVGGGTGQSGLLDKHHLNKQRLGTQRNCNNDSAPSASINKQSKVLTRDQQAGITVPVRSDYNVSQRQQANVSSRSQLHQQVKNRNGVLSAMPLSRSKQASLSHHQDSGFDSPYDT